MCDQVDRFVKGYCDFGIQERKDVAQEAFLKLYEFATKPERLNFHPDKPAGFIFWKLRNFCRNKIKKDRHDAAKEPWILEIIRSLTGGKPIAVTVDPAEMASPPPVPNLNDASDPSDFKFFILDSLRRSDDVATFVANDIEFYLRQRFGQEKFPSRKLSISVFLTKCQHHLTLAQLASLLPHLIKLSWLYNNGHRLFTDYLKWLNIDSNDEHKLHLFNLIKSIPRRLSESK